MTLSHSTPTVTPATERFSQKSKIFQWAGVRSYFLIDLQKESMVPKTLLSCNFMMQNFLYTTDINFHVIPQKRIP
jgi:hypothetical protein